LPEPIAGLLATLPERWTVEERQRFLATFEAVLDYSIPLIEPDDERAGLQEENH
jgi:hypothetical protein